MRYTLISLLLVLSPVWASAQKNNLFADVGLDDGAGFSITDNYKLTKHIGLGIGVQGYNYDGTFAKNTQFIPAIFEDMRFYFPRKKHMFFTFLDLGINLYSGNDNYQGGNTVYDVSNNNGFYTGLGFGYFRRMTKRGSGVYVSFKIVSNSYSAERYHIVSNTHDHSSYVEAGGALSVGFKF